MPLIRRIPKRGFNNASHTIEFIPVNLEALNRFEEGAKVDETALRSLGLANCWRDPASLPDHPTELGDGPRVLTPEQEADRTRHWPPL